MEFYNIPTKKIKKSKPEIEVEKLVKTGLTKTEAIEIIDRKMLIDNDYTVFESGSFNYVELE
jgi:hypothetical protein